MIHSLNVSQSGLMAAKTTVENVMNNIANENTPGYKKRTVTLSESEQLDSRTYGRGVSIGETVRVTNLYMYDNLMKEQSKESYLDEMSTMLSDIESIFYETEDSGLSNDMDRFFQAIEDMRSNPYNEIYKNNLKNQANIVVEDLKNLYQGIEDREQVSKNGLYDDVDTINNILSDIGKINEEIGRRVGQSNDLLDRRDALEAELAGFIDLSIDRSDDYELKIGGLTAVRYNTNIHNVKVVENYIPQKNVYSDDTFADNIFPPGSNPFDTGDKVTVRINNVDNKEFSITYGEAFSGFDLDGDGVNDAGTVDKDNYLRVLANKINQQNPLQVQAFNGNYTLDEEGNKVTNDAQDNFLLVESVIDGQIGKFEMSIVIEDSSAGTKSIINKNEKKSRESVNDVHIEIFDAEMNMQRGSLKAITENLDTQSGSNLFTKYKEALDSFANTLSDITSAYIKQPTGDYVYGQKATMIDTSGETINEIKLFSGSNVDSLEFNLDAINNLGQQDIDYLASLQWKDNILFDGSAQDSNTNSGTSFSKFYQTLHVEISADKESNDFLLTTQESVTQSLKATYDKMVKVDKDEEMINLIQFQAAYEANAKIITVVDEMLQTLLGIKR